MRSIKKSLLMSSVILASSISSSLVNAAPFASEARSLGMGTVSVATADIATAALTNPAMLSYQQEKEDFSLLLSIGALIDDSSGMIDSIDAFTSANNAFTLGDVTNANAMRTAALDLNNKALTPSALFSAVVGFSFQEYSLAFSARGEFVTAAGLSDSTFVTAPAMAAPATNATEANAIASAISSGAKMRLDGSVLTEVGLSAAKSFNVAGKKMSIGLTPKITSVESFTTGSLPIEQFDTDDFFDSNNSTSLGEAVTLDVGFVSQLSESTQVGLVIKNLIEDTLKSPGGNTVVNIGRQVTLGVAYRGDLYTIGIDLDLMESDPVFTNTSFNLKTKATQMASIGMEFNAWDFMQLRIGAQKNLADNAFEVEDTLLTAGVGIWIGVNVDVAVMASGDTLGGMVNTGFKF